MYKREKSKKDALLPHLVYRLLEMYAGGFEYFEDPQDTCFAKCTAKEQQKARRKYMLECQGDPFPEKATCQRKALLIQEEGEIRCRAGGLSVTMLAEMVLVVYYSRYVKIYDEEIPTTRDQYQKELDNMRDYILRLIKKDQIIRCVPRAFEYFGYYKKGNGPQKPLLFQMESDPLTEPDKEKLISLDGKEVYLDCFGRKESPLYLSYQLMDNTWYIDSTAENADTNSGKKKNSRDIYLMLNRLYQQNNSGELILIEDHTEGWPQKLLAENPLFPDESISQNAEGWSCFGKTLNLQQSGMVYIRPAYSASQNTGIPMQQGRYYLAWHQTKDGIDCIVLTFFDPKSKNMPGMEGKKPILAMQDSWMAQMQKKMQQAEESNEKFEFKRSKTSKEQEGKQSEWFKIVKNLSWDQQETELDESCILFGKEENEPEGFLLTNLVHRDFWGYRHKGNKVLPDMLIFWVKQKQPEKSKSAAQEEVEK